MEPGNEGEDDVPFQLKADKPKPNQKKMFERGQMTLDLLQFDRAKEEGIGRLSAKSFLSCGCLTGRIGSDYPIYLPLQLPRSWASHFSSCIAGMERPCSD